MTISSFHLDRRTFLSTVATVVAASALPRQVVAAKTGRIGFAMGTYMVPRYKNLDKPNFEEAVRAGGYDPVVVQANDNVDQQLQDVQNLLSQGVDVLVIIPVVSNTAVSMVRLAKRDGVPVIAYNTAIPSGDVAAFVSRDNRSVGRQAAQAAADTVGLEGKWVIASGQAGNAVADEVTAGYFEVLQPQIDAGAVEIVSHEYHASWDPEEARQQTEDALTASGDDIKGVFANNDGMAGGAIAALERQGLAGKVFVSGQDATTEACRYILEGKMTLSSFTRFDVMGQIAGDLAVKLARGEAISAPMQYTMGDVTVPLYPVEDFNVTRDNIADYFAQYSPGYVDASAALNGLSDDILPEGVAQYR
jgi:ABC-type xylose transport system substrate-binding protein